VLDVLVVGAGASGLNAAVTPDHPGEQAGGAQRRAPEVFPDNTGRLDEAVRSGKIELILRANAAEFADREVKFRRDGKKDSPVSLCPPGEEQWRRWGIERNDKFQI